MAANTLYGADREVSGLSVASSSAADNQTLQLLAEAAEAAKAKEQDAMDVDIPRIEDSNTSSPLSDVNSEPEEAASSAKPVSALNDAVEPTIIRTADGKIIVETLDTPALRKQKAIMRRAERERLKQGADMDPSLSGHAGPSQLSGGPEANASHASEGQDNLQARSASQTAVSMPPRDPAAVILEEGQTLDGGTLVWAKARKCQASKISSALLTLRQIHILGGLQLYSSRMI